MKILFKKTILLVLSAALAVTALPLLTARAAGNNDPTPPPTEQVSNEKLEQVWARQLHKYERLGKGFDRLDTFTDKAQRLIDKAKENGKDVSAVQAALDAFAAAAKEAEPVYASARGIVESHEGFDDNGKVIDLEKAKETVKSMHDKLKEIKSAMNGTGKALREAIKAFREANPRPQPTPEGS
jgi:hypothetical protein